MIRYSYQQIADLAPTFKSAGPYQHVILDNFLEDDVAHKIASEFPGWDDPAWYTYDNAIEKKRAMNIWDRFKENTYKTLSELMTPSFVNALSWMSGIDDLQGDYGLSGGGLHMHGRGQKLNVHMDYSIHPKLKMERRLNIIIYTTPNWNPEWGGGLELWSHDPENFKPKECVKRVENVFNRAIIFNTTMNSWHGLPTPINCPEGIYRTSLAAYYVSNPREGCDPREKALFAPTAEQANDPAILDLIKKRSSSATAKDVHQLL